MISAGISSTTSLPLATVERAPHTSVTYVRIVLVCSLFEGCIRYYCPPKSQSPTAMLCGNASVYCPPGSATPLWVEPGYVAAGGANSSVRTSQIACGIGEYCLNGVATSCPIGFLCGPVLMTVRCRIC